MRISKGGTDWDKQIRWDFPSETWDEYIKAQKEVESLASRTGIELDIKREAAYKVIYGKTRTFEAIRKLKYVHSDPLRLYDLERVREFVRKHGQERVNEGKGRLSYYARRYREGKLSREDFFKYIEDYKKTPRYLANGSE